MTLILNRPLKVLLIEDDEDDFVIARDLFDEIPGQPYRLTWISSFADGQEALQHDEHDVYLIDYRLGVESGLDLLAEAVTKGCQAPLILLTGLGDHKIEIQAMKAGAADYLVKGQITPALLDRSISHSLERKKIERKLRESEEQYRLLFEKNPHPMWVADCENLRFLAVNEAAIRHYGYDAHEFLAMTLQDLQPLNEALPLAEFHLQTQDSFDSDTGLRGIWRHRQKPGGIITVEIMSNRISFRERPALLILANDVTERLQLEAQLRQSQKMESIGTLAGGVAHDFNNILGIIGGYVSFLRLGTIKPEELEKSLNAVDQAVQRGAALVRHILTFARKTDVALKSVDVNGLIEELAKMLSGTFPKTIIFSLELDREVPPLFADPSQLHQSLLNLFVNARDAMPGGGTLTISTGVVAGAEVHQNFAEAREPGYVCIRVTDTGIGMDENTRARVFEPFFTTKARTGGSGLGLAVVYGVVKSHHGFVDVESGVGLGTRFRIYLPIPASRPPTISAPVARAEETERGNETILVVEDEELLLELLKATLEGRGYQVLTARDGIEAIEVFGRDWKEISLVVADLGLPRLGGWEAYLKMREIDPEVKAILASGYLEPDLRSEILNSGAQAFVQKPYVLGEMLSNIRNVLGPPRAESRSN